MSKRSLVNLLLVVSLLWLIGCTYCYVCKIKGHCNKQDTPVKVVDKKVDQLNISGLSIQDGNDLNITNPKNIYYDFGGSNLFVEKEVTPSFDLLAEYLKANPDKNVVITGKYLGREGGSDLGLARADSFVKYFSKKYGIEASRMKTSFKQVGDLVVDSKLNRTYGALDFAFNTDRSKSQDVADNEDLQLDKLKEELSKVRIVYFDYGSSNMKTNPKLHQFFTDLKYYIGKRKGAKASLVGHTDDSGSNASNQKLSRARCQDVAAFLMKNHSFSTGDFIQKGMGETQPIASNSTQEGMAKNRRVEISLKH